MFIWFKCLFPCFLFLGIVTNLYSQDTTELRIARFENLKNCLNEHRINSAKLINWYKNYKLTSSKTYHDLEQKIDQFDKSLKSKNAPDSYFIRRVADNYEDLTQLIISVYDSLAKSSKIPKSKKAIGVFFNSYYKAENAIDFYDDLNWNNQSLLFRIYTRPYPSLL